MSVSIIHKIGKLVMNNQRVQCKYINYSAEKKKTLLCSKIVIFDNYSIMRIKTFQKPNEICLGTDGQDGSGLQLEKIALFFEFLFCVIEE